MACQYMWSSNYSARLLWDNLPLQKAIQIGRCQATTNLPNKNNPSLAALQVPYMP